MGEVVGLLVLLLVGAIATLVTLSVLIACDAVRPPRHTAGYAVAHGLPIDPGDLGLEFEVWVLDLSGSVALPVWEPSSSAVVQFACTVPRSPERRAWRRTPGANMRPPLRTCATHC